MHVNTPTLRRDTFLGASRSWDSQYPYEAYRDVRAFPYSPPSASALVAPWMDAALASMKSVTEMRNAAVTFDAALKANNQFAVDMRAYYDNRVGRTSGGKRDRLRDERAALQDGVDRANKVLSAAIGQLNALAEAKTKGTLAVNPDNLTRQVNPETGEVFYTPPSQAASTASGTSQPSSMAKFALPLAAAAAAYFALK